MTLKEAQEVVTAVSEKLDPSAKVIWGAQVQKDLENTLRAMIIVTGVQSPQIFGPDQSFKVEYTKEIEKELGIEFV